MGNDIDWYGNAQQRLRKVAVLFKAKCLPWPGVPP